MFWTPKRVLLLKLLKEILASIRIGGKKRNRSHLQVLETAWALFHRTKDFPCTADQHPE
jgi:hypothetical protein